MRFLSLSTLILALTLPTQALAVPGYLSHQGRLYDSTGTALTGAHSVTYRLYDAPAGGSAVWQETLNNNFENGFYSALLGSTNPIDASILAGFSLHLAIAIDGGPELGSRLPLSSVPYAIWSERAQQADQADTLAAGAVIDASEIRVNGITVIDGSGAISGTVMWEDIDGVPANLTSPSALASLACSAGQQPTIVGGAWTCAADNAHTHNAADVAAGVLDINRLPLGNSSGTVAAGDHIHSYTELSNKPVTLSDLSACATGQIPVYNGSTWTCAADKGLTVESDPTVNALAKATLSCGTAQVPKWNGTAWACANDLDTHPTWDTLAGIPSGFADGVDNGLTVESDPTVNALAKATLGCANGQIAKFNGSIWACAADSTSGGTVTGVTASAPLASSGGAAPNLTITQATGSTAGYLTAADWTTFNGKVGSVAATSGGGIVVAGTATAPTVGLSTACASGQTLKWNGAAWACAADIATAQMPIQTVCGWRTCGNLNATNLSSCTPDACPTGYTSVDVSCSPIAVAYATGIATYAPSMYTDAACTSLTSNGSGNVMVGACHRSCERTVPSANVIAVTECGWRTCGDLNQANLGSCSPPSCPSGYSSINTGCTPTGVEYAQGIGGFANSMYTNAACTTLTPNRSGNITIGKCFNTCQK